jgi:hypothetical protein
MHGAGPDGGLIAFQRRCQQRPGIHLRLIDSGADVIGRLSGAAARQVLAQFEQCRSEQADRQRDRLIRQGRHPERQLRRQVVRRQRQPGQWPVLDRVGQLENDPEQMTLKRHRRRQVGLEIEELAPAGGRGLQAGLPDGRRQRNVGHGN